MDSEKRCPACRKMLHGVCSKCGRKCWCYMTQEEIQRDRAEYAERFFKREEKRES